ncbi:type II secretion system F family protein [Glaciihabitans sp. dw_435]|uniref:type II secretion system F family protein n=1 Tax=Glaciihabitans sp. dw_435 TaxID=2720081 RepID=UPI001BD58A07|nr:type II secretion system F family protein [Glaciihabitans sp. dw_435]
MAVVFGLLLGTGAVLTSSVFFWPRASNPPARTPSPLVTRVRDRLVQAGLGRVSVPLLIVVSTIVGVAAGAIALALAPVLIIGIAAGCLGLTLPLAVVTWRARSQRRATRVVWPDVVDHLVSAVRSGLALPDGIVSLARTGPVATRAAFADFERDYRLTGNFSSSIDGLKNRLADPVADRILETLRMSREVGGHELAAVLRNLSVYLRQDAVIRAEVEARQSWVVNAARLGVAAPWVILILLSTRPEAAAAYNTAAGTAVIAFGAVLSLIAYRLMMSLGRLPEERRWFR